MPTSMVRFSRRLTHRFKQRFRHPPKARPASRLDQNGLRQCVRVADHVYVLELGRNKIDESADDFAHDTALRELIAEWVDYRIDA